MRHTIQILENTTGIVIPLYLHDSADIELALTLLRDTVHAFVREINDPTNICLSVDGSPTAMPLAQQMVAEYGVQMVQAEQNRGKLSAVMNGMKHLLANPDLRYFAAIDSDGDHFANELLNFIRAAEHVAALEKQERIIVLGDRRSRNRPLGFLRGDLEELADRVLLDALHYDAVIQSKPLVLQFTNTLDEFPDFHSGYKVFSRATAQDVFLNAPNLAGCSETAYYRHACEAVPIVEALQHGATLCTVNRRTFDEQPMSSFARLDRGQLNADMIIWPCKRLAIPGSFVDQWLTNHIHRLPLSTLVPAGREELGSVCNLVRQAFGVATSNGEPNTENSTGELSRSLFI